MDEPVGGTDELRVGIATTEEERHEIYRFRYGVYIEELQKYALSAADHERKWIYDPWDDEAVLYFVKYQGRLIATLRMNYAAEASVPESFWELYALDRFTRFTRQGWSFTSRLMVDKAMRGSMAIAALFDKAYSESLRRGVQADFCYCTPALVALYEHLGYRRFTKNYLDKEMGLRVPMLLLTRDLEQMERVASPFAFRLKEHPAGPDPDAHAWFAEAFPGAPDTAEWLLEKGDFWKFLYSKLRAPLAVSVPLAAGLSDAEGEEVIHQGTILRCDAGEKLIRRSDVGNEMYLVLSGGLEVKEPGGRSLAVFGPGEIVGEIACLTDAERTADVEVVESGEFLVLTQSHLKRLIRKKPEIAAQVLFNLSRILCERLAYGTRRRA